MYKRKMTTFIFRNIISVSNHNVQNGNAFHAPSLDIYIHTTQSDGRSNLLVMSCYMFYIWHYLHQYTPLKYPIRRKYLSVILTSQDAQTGVRRYKSFIQFI
jgi:hypothetical protein